MNGISKREKGMLIILFIIIIGYVYYSLFYIPLQKKMLKSRQSINRHIEVINTARINEELFGEKAKELDRIKAKYEKAKLLIPHIEKNPEIITNLQRFSKESGVEIINITLGEPEVMKRIGDQKNNKNETTVEENQVYKQSSEELFTVPVSISLSANSYEDAMKFLSLFENDRRYVEVNNFVITIIKRANVPQTLITEKTIEKDQLIVRPQVDYDKIDILVIGEGKEYKETPVNRKKNSDYIGKEKAVNKAEYKQSSENLLEPGLTAEASLIGRYYYTAVKANESK